MFRRSTALVLGLLVAALPAALPAPVSAQNVNSELEGLRRKQEEMAAALAALQKERAESAAREQKLLAQMAEMARQFNDLRARAILADKVDETKRVTEFICPAGHAHDDAAAGGKCPDCGAAQEARETVRKVRVARREAIGDKIAAALEEDAQRRVSVATSATGIYQQIIGNDSDATRDRGHAEGSLDIFLITRPMPYSLFFIDLEAVGGQGPDREVGSLAGLNGDAGRNVVQTEGNDSVNVREVWLRGDLFSDHLHVVAGKIDLANYFDRNRVANDETSQFLTDAFVNNSKLGTPALNGAGLAIWYETKTGWAFGAGVQKPTDEGFRIADGDYGIVEADWQTYLLGREGNIRAWARMDDTEPNEAWATGVSVDQEITSSITAFGRYGFADVHNGTDGHTWSAGAQLRTPFEARPRDVVGLAFGQIYSALDRAELDHDTVLESYYRFVVNEHVAVSLVFQHLFHTAGDGADLPAQDDVSVIGLRAQIDF